MKRFTVFTLMYLATGICFTAIAFGQPDSTPSLKKSLLFSAGMLYIIAALSTFRFWHRSILKSQSTSHDSSFWRRKRITPWLIIAVTSGSSIYILLTDHWTTDAIAQVVSQLPIILLCVESIFSSHQIQS